MSEAGGSDDIRQLSAQYEQLSEVVEELQQVVTALESEIQGCKDAIESIEGLEQNSEILVPLGGGSFIKAKVEEVDEILVDIGADIRVEYDQDSAVDSIKSRVEQLQERKEDTESEMEKRREQLEQVARRVQAAQSQQQPRG